MDTASGSWPQGDIWGTAQFWELRVPGSTVTSQIRGVGSRSRKGRRHATGQGERRLRSAQGRRGTSRRGPGAQDGSGPAEGRRLNSTHRMNRPNRRQRRGEESRGLAPPSRQTPKCAGHQAVCPVHMRLQRAVLRAKRVRPSVLSCRVWLKTATRCPPCFSPFSTASEILQGRSTSLT